MRQHHTTHPGTLMGHGPPSHRRFSYPAASRTRCAGHPIWGIANSNNSAGSALGNLPGFLLVHARHHGAALANSPRFGYGLMTSVLGAA